MKPQLTLRVFVVHDGSTGAAQVKTALVGLAPLLGMSCAHQEFELLAYPQVGTDSAGLARESDLIIVAACAGTELPAHVEDWFESWIFQGLARRTALVVLLHGNENAPSQPTSLRTKLRRIAEEAGVDFFCNLGERRAAHLAPILDLFGGAGSGSVHLAN